MTKEESKPPDIMKSIAWNRNKNLRRMQNFGGLGAALIAYFAAYVSSHAL